MQVHLHAKAAAAGGLAIACLVTSGPAHAGACRDTKVIQACQNNLMLLQGPCSQYISEPGGAMYQSCMASAASMARTTCYPVSVPCDYDETNPLGLLQELVK